MRSSERVRRNEFSQRQEITADLVKSAGRTIQILEYFADIAREASIHEVSTSLGYPHSSTSAILQTLMHMGHMSFNRQTRSYKPLSTLAVLGSWVDDRVAQNGPVLSLMRSVATNPDYMVVLGRRNGLHAKFIYVIQPADPRRHCPIGSRRALVDCSAGRIILSGLSNPEIVRVANHAIAAKVALTNVTPSQLIEDVEQFRSEGFLFRPTAAEGLSTIAIAVPDVDGPLPMSMTISGPHAEIERDIPALLEVVRTELAERLEVEASFAMLKANA